jgi:hypothetical protein
MDDNLESLANGERGTSVPPFTLSNRSGDIKSVKVLWLKGGLFVLIGLVAAALLLLESPTWKTALFLAVAVWGFCRAYYFAFYVLEHYVDKQYRFSGLIAFIFYALRKRRGS